VARGPCFALYVAPAEKVLSVHDGRAASRLRVELVQGHRDAEVEGVEEREGKANYFVGNDPRRWRTDVPTFAKVRCRSVYPGIDLVYHGHPRELEYDFVVAPGADPGRIRLRFDGAEAVRLNEAGHLVMALEGAEVVHRTPRVYQEAAGAKEVVASLPLVSSINYSAGQTRGNNAIARLGAAGVVAARCTQASGMAHLVLDVNGYFE
jgi:hypothetical protein